MSDPIAPVQNNSQPVAEAQQTPGKSAANSNFGDVSANTTIKDMTELQRKAPKIYKLFQEGIMTNMISQIRDHEQKMKQIRQDNERNNRS